MPVVSGRLAPMVRGFEVLADHDGAQAEIDEIEPADQAEPFEQGRADAVGADDRRDCERSPGDIADKMAGDEPGPRGAPARGGESEEREERRPGCDDVEKGGDEGRGENLRVGHAGFSSMSRFRA